MPGKDHPSRHLAGIAANPRLHLIQYRAFGPVSCVGLRLDVYSLPRPTVCAFNRYDDVAFACHLLDRPPIRLGDSDFGEGREENILGRAPLAWVDLGKH
jgi:hypothetical protein